MEEIKAKPDAIGGLASLIAGELSGIDMPDELKAKLAAILSPEGIKAKAAQAGVKGVKIERKIFVDAENGITGAEAEEIARKLVEWSSKTGRTLVIGPEGIKEKGKGGQGGQGAKETPDSYILVSKSGKESPVDRGKLADFAKKCGALATWEKAHPDRKGKITAALPLESAGFKVYGIFAGVRKIRKGDSYVIEA